MSDVQAIQTEAAPDFSALNDDDALGAVWDQLERDNGAARGDDGKFTSGEGGDEPAGDDAQPAAVEGEEGGDDQTATETQTPAVALPPNWNGMDEDWKKIPADVQAKIAARDTELHARMSEQGRQIGAFKPFVDVIEKNRDLFEGRQMADGRAVTPTFAVDFLMGVQRQLDADPIGTLIQIADRYEARDMLVAVLTGQARLPPVPQPQASAGVKPADVQAMVRETLDADQTARAAEEEISRLSKDKPLYASIAEADMVHFIRMARSKLGDAASNEAVFNRAYDMAVNADPDLRAKAAAAAKPAAAAPDPRRTADARRAASVNVTSTSTGKSRNLTEDELLAQAFDDAQKDR
ncbi:hypothetical protein NS365_13335 [Aureimonas ureilytica]|uniref:Uncharacterized protein n=1 Tax=Aureimonas ureilytica TaxID=401562 RepID=A0A175RMR7_9HYPH|nr:hypothetical protein [Aureimonas ureilytica]KTR05006.1 hypothetical protein NS365_13335 [Aureimonas ureilytica]